MVYNVRGINMCKNSALFETVSDTEKDIFKRSVAEYIVMANLELLDDSPLSPCANTIPHPLFVEENLLTT